MPAGQGKVGAEAGKALFHRLLVGRCMVLLRAR